jgi:hypothetical protein
MDFKKTFDDLKASLVGVKSTDTDEDLDQSIEDILSYRSNSGRVGYVDYLQTMISKSASNMQSFKNMNDLNYGGNGTIGSEHGRRIARYHSYESITAYINYCKRALDVLVDNILSPDDIDKISLNVFEKEAGSTSSDKSVKTKEIKKLLSDLNIEKNVGLIAKTTLHLGDYFCEITDNKKVFSSKSLLTEQLIEDDNSESFVSLQEKYEYTDLTHSINGQGAISNANINIILDFQAQEIPDEIRDKNDDKDKKNIATQNVKIVYHRPAQVVKLQSELYPICFGYLVFPKYQLHHNLSIEEQYVNNICKKILNGIEKKGITIKNLDSETNKDLQDIITQFIKSSNRHDNMTIRYVPPDKMCHFHVPSLRYSPYGESIFDSCQFTAKLIISLETALTIQRINRSTEKRKIGIEIGLPRDASNLIQKMKESFKKRKVSVDDFGSVDTIPSQISTFEDVYVPQKDGKPFVEIETFDGMGRADTAGKTDELMQLIGQLVASLGVPRQFLGLEENTTWKNTLSEENILFARTIIYHQKYLNEQISDLVYKIYKVIDPDFSLEFNDRYSINFPPPQSLQFERQSKYIGDIVTMVNSLKEIGVPLEYSKKKFITQIDWDEVAEYVTKEKMDKIEKGGDEEDGGGGYGGSSY